MKSRLLAGLLLASGLVVCAQVSAQPGPERGYQYQDKSGEDQRRPGGPGPGDDRNNNRMTPQRWHKGDRLPTEYRDRQYMVEDWRQYNLPAPPKGRHWVGVGADFYLVAPNGAIMDMGPGGR
ncbi:MULTISPECIES: RcnB family protein [unclassified Cupriavidus]|uniref:RcnB family protein n=1 Tax=unclassified Cupriavidus TaxID=2640874 RepID=UPI003F903D53